MQEIWKDIEGYEGLYQVSNLGRVRALPKRKWNGRVWCDCKGYYKKQSNNGSGYLIVNLKKGGNQKNYLVHRLVAMTFIANKNEYPCVNHIDLNKQNNNVNNLEWCTHKENTTHAHVNGRKPKYHNKPVVCVELNLIFNSVGEAERWLKLKGNRISSVCNGRRGCKTCGGYHWKFLSGEI